MRGAGIDIPASIPPTTGATPDDPRPRQRHTNNDPTDAPAVDRPTPLPHVEDESMTTPLTGPAYGEGVHYHLPRRVRGLRVRVVATFVVAALVALAIALAAFTFGLRQILTSSAGDSATTEAQQVARELSTTDDASAALRAAGVHTQVCLLYTSPSPRDLSTSRMPSSA